MGAKFEIQLEQDTFYKSLFDDTNSLFLLRGKVLLTPSTSIHAHRILLYFRGELVLNRSLQSTRKTLFEYQWNFLEETGSKVFRASPYSFDFEFPLPADLPESAVASYGKIQYSLKATIETPIFIPNITAHKDVYIHNGSRPLVCMSYNTHLEANWRNLVDYEIMIPCPEYVPGDTIPITFKHRSLSHRCKLISVWAGLEEQTLYSRVNGDTITGVEPVRKKLETSGTAIENASDTSFLSLCIPKAHKQVHLHCTTPYIEVTHTIYTRIEVELDGEIQCIRAIIPIYLISDTRDISIPECVNDIDQLPSYYSVRSDCPPDYPCYMTEQRELST